MRVYLRALNLFLMLFWIHLANINAQSTSGVTAPQVAVGSSGGLTYTTTLDVTNPLARDCLLALRLHRGATLQPDIPILTNGMDQGFLITDTISAGEKQRYTLTAPAGTGEISVFAATFFPQNGCGTIQFQAGYQIQTAGETSEIFSYPLPLSIPLGSCAVSPLSVSTIPALAVVGNPPDYTHDLILDLTLFDEAGVQVGPTQSVPYNGQHLAKMLNFWHPGQPNLSGRWQVCPKQATAGDPPQFRQLVDMLFLGVDSSSFQLATSAHTVRGSTCIEDETTLCLNEGRFKVQIDWFIGDSATKGLAWPGAKVFGQEFGILHFANDQMLVHVMNACTTSYKNFWVFAAANTNQRYSLTVTDTRTGTEKIYSNPLGQASLPIADTSAFATCP